MTTRLWVSLGAAASLALTLYAGRHSPILLMVLFAAWVVTPFAGFLWLKLESVRLALTLAVVSISAYAYAAFAAEKPKTPVFLILPLGLWVAVAAARTVGRTKT